MHRVRPTPQSLTPAVFNQDLTQELAQVEGKRFLDDKWFDLDSNGQIILVDRPLDFLSRFWEMLVRFFTTKLERLDLRFCSIVNSVAYYVEHETDNDRLVKFLDRFTPVLNEIEYSSSALKAAGRIHGLAKDQITQAWREKVQVDRNRLYHIFHQEKYRFPYKATGTLRLINESPLNNVQFNFTNPESRHWNGGYSRFLPGYSEDERPVVSDLSACDDLTQVTGTISKVCSTPTEDEDYRITITEQGGAVFQRTPLEDASVATRHLTFVNQSTKELTLDLWVTNQQGNHDRYTFHIGAGSSGYERMEKATRPAGRLTGRFEIKERFTHTFKPHLNCGEYEYRVTAEGKLLFRQRLLPAAD